MEEEEITIQPDKNGSKSNSDIREDKTQVNTEIKTSKTVVKKSSSHKSKLSLKSRSSAKSKLSSKSRSVKYSPSNKILLTKSLDSVKALLASKESSADSLKEADSVKKINRATSIGAFLKKRMKRKKSNRYNHMCEKFQKVDSVTVAKIARELIRKKGCSLLNIHPIKEVKKRPAKKKPKDQNFL